MFTVGRVSSVVAVSTALICAVALPATATETDPKTTTVSFTVGSGTLSVSAPENANFGDNVTPGLPATVDLAGVTVTDTRAQIVTWDASVILEDFTGGTTGRKIGATEVTYSALGTANLVEASNAVPTPKVAVGLSPTTGKSILTAVATGNNTVKWYPKLAMVVPITTLADTYTATLTHSVL